MIRFIFGIFVGYCFAEYNLLTDFSFIMNEIGLTDYFINSLEGIKNTD